MNDTYSNTTRSPSAALPVVACSACGHPSAEHDRIAARFCTATTVGHHDRGCVCTAGSSTAT
ncbi:RGCVC family protein [Actinophytocola algeriensis]|uniref:RGCVC family protein n=1 Tax=Actinophytocola algeriensis TaxID=1768010 RepID=UPI001C879286|nr:RGCVC family protein [Actinophytocola algeriensis]